MVARGRGVARPTDVDGLVVRLMRIGRPRQQHLGIRHYVGSDVGFYD